MAKRAIARGDSLAPVTLHGGIHANFLAPLPEVKTAAIFHAVKSRRNELAQKVGRFVTAAQFAFET